VKIKEVGIPSKPLSVYSFRLQVIHAMRTAYQMACEEPRLKDAGDGASEVVAEKILELAEAGETDPQLARLRCAAYRTNRASRSDWKRLPLSARQLGDCRRSSRLVRRRW
jgi:hypothetical protein